MANLNKMKVTPMNLNAMISTHMEQEQMIREMKVAQADLEHEIKMEVIHDGRTDCLKIDWAMLKRGME